MRVRGEKMKGRREGEKKDWKKGGRRIGRREGGREGKELKEGKNKLLIITE